MLVKLLGAPVQEGSGRRGCDMGPAAYRAAGLAESLIELGHEVTDLGDISPAPRKCPHPTTDPGAPRARLSNPSASNPALAAT